MVTYTKNTSKKASSFSTATPNPKNVTFTNDTAGGHETSSPAANMSFASPTEGVICRHTYHDASAPATPTKPFRSDYIPAMALVTVTISGKAFPVCQSTGFQGAYDVTFRGCLGCGQMDHNTFKDCPRKDNPAIWKEFFNNLHAHKPQYRVKYERTLELRK